MHRNPFQHPNRTCIVAAQGGSHPYQETQFTPDHQLIANVGHGITTVPQTYFVASRVQRGALFLSSVL